jgi:DNA-binding SARP family transcriptional activator
LEAHAWFATALIENGCAQQSVDALERARAIVKGVEAPKLEFHHLLIDANAHLALGNATDAQQSLRKAFAIARAHGYTNGFQHVPAILGRLCAEALEHDIEPQYVRRLIQLHGLRPASTHICDAWPWAVRVRVLGAFDLRVADAPVAFGTKAQKKPLELLKALVAKGLHGCNQRALAQELWPDSEGDVAESALRMALHRLRKLLHDDESIIVSEGKLRLNDKICRVDAWALEALCSTLEDTGAQARAGQSDRLLALYAGPPFEGEALQPWMLPARERWRSKFLRAVDLIGTAEEARGSREQALEIYRRGLEADPLSEDLYCRMMSCYLEQGKAAEAYCAYRRCRDILSLTLGVRPSPRTEGLRQRAVELGAPH